MFIQRNLTREDVQQRAAQIEQMLEATRTQQASLVAEQTSLRLLEQFQRQGVTNALSRGYIAGNV